MRNRFTIEEIEESGVELRPIPGYLGYAAGSDGHVYSFRSSSTAWGYSTKCYRIGGSILSPNGKDYLRTELVKFPGGGRGFEQVHRLVCSAFHGLCPDGMECSHLNGDSMDNRPENLTWEPHKQNCLRGVSLGTIPKGESHYGSKLTEDDVQQVVLMSSRGVSQPKIAKAFGVSRGAICDILIGKNWAHITTAKTRKGEE